MVTWPVNRAVDLGFGNLGAAAGQAAELSELGLGVVLSCISNSQLSNGISTWLCVKINSTFDKLMFRLGRTGIKVGKAIDLFIVLLKFLTKSS